MPGSACQARPGIVRHRAQKRHPGTPERPQKVAETESKSLTIPKFIDEVLVDDTAASHAYHRSEHEPSVRRIAPACTFNGQTLQSAATKRAEASQDTALPSTSGQRAERTSGIEVIAHSWRCRRRYSSDSDQPSSQAGSHCGLSRHSQRRAELD